MQNVSSSRFGWYAPIKMNHDLADLHYIMDTNRTMFMCALYFGKMSPRVGTELKLLKCCSQIGHDSLSRHSLQIQNHQREVYVSSTRLQGEFRVK